MATNASPEFLTIQQHFVDLQGAIIRGNVPAALFQNRLVSPDGFTNATNDAVGSTKRGRETVMEVLEAVRSNPALFEKFCCALEVEKDVTGEIIHKMKDTLKDLKKTHSVQPPEETVEFQRLKDQLEAFHSTMEATAEENIRQQTMNCSQHLIQRYIENGLRSGIEASKIKSDMEKLSSLYLVLARSSLGWAMLEVDKASKKLKREVQRVAMPLAEKKHQEPPLFSKDTLYHASICCEAINDVMPSNPLSFFRNKKPQHSLTEVSFSQCKDGTTPYLIAKQNDVVYVAFQGVPEVSQWMKSASSFNEGLRKQSSKIPLRFFMDELLNNKKIVLTGFSFGGMLASCISARLWHNTMADQEALAQRMICITFGQPLLQMKMVEEEICISPQFEQSIHCIFIKDDLVPLTFSYLPVDERKPPPSMSPVVHPKTKAVVASDAVPQATAQTLLEPVSLFGNTFVKMFLQNLSTLQEQHLKSEGTPKMAAAIEWLEKAIAQLMEQVPPTLYGNCYVISRERDRGVVWQPKSKQTAAIELSHHSKVDTKLFQKHSMGHYIPLILRSHLEKPVKYVLPNRGKSVTEVSEVDALKPKIYEPLTYCDYPNERVVVVEGDNLWFSYKVCLDEKGPNECEFSTDPENTTQFTIKFQAELEESTDFGSFQQVKLALHTQFANPIRQTLNIKTEPHFFSVRQMQLARHTPSQVIKLAYLCALLEQRNHGSDSKRFTAIANFLKEAVQVVPIESVFDAITYGNHEIALTCAKALKERSLQLQPSQHMIVGALKASIRATTGYDGTVINRLIIPTVKTFQQAIQAVHWWLQSNPLPGHPIPLPPIGVPVATQILVPSNPQQSMKARSKPRTPIGVHATTGKKAQSPSQKPQPSKMYSDVAKSSPVQATQLMTMPLPFPIFLDSYLHPAPVTFPQYLIKYLKECLIGHYKTALAAQYGLNIVTRMNISELYSAVGRKSAHFKSPLQILSEGLSKISAYTEVDTPPAAKLPNEQMLALIDKIFKIDVTLCASLLGAFMEQQICIPLIHTPKNTAETLSSKTAPVAVGVWALFSQNLASLQAKLKGSNRSQLIIDIREYMEGISQQLENEDRMYAGKLQFLLHGMQRNVTASSQYISYSLERQLCSNPKFDRNSTLKSLITQWDTIFKNDALSLIGESHRPLVARWLKWTILVHDLREALAQYTCIGVTGFVNSGKSLLVKKLFKIKKVKVGIQAVKRTTVPLLYNLEDSIEGLDVIDFPGVDDSDHTIPELAQLLLSLAQIIVFVVDFKRAFSDPVKAWLQALTKNGAPIHICLTHADLLYSECKAEGKLDNIAEELKRICAHFKLDAHREREVTFYSFNRPSDVSVEELKQCGINSAIDVGNWLVHVLRNRFKQDELAEKLKSFIQTH